MTELTASRLTPVAPTSGVTPPVSAFWLSVWSVTLGVGWLLPNHYPPWSSFHFDVWSSVAFIVIALTLILRSRAQVRWSGLTLLTAALTVVPALQYAFGLITQAGNAWVSTAYLLGFLLALLTGARWEASGTAQPADGLFLAIGMASLLSVGLQLHQWLMLDRLDIWSMGGGFGRPFANFGQPNQLGTFLLWGILGAIWAFVRKHIGAGVAIGAALYLLFGLALTASRTAWVAVAMIVLMAWIWRGLWPTKRMPWVVTFLGLYFVVCTLSVGWLTQVLTGGVPLDIAGITRISGELRPAVWSMFLDAAWQKPIFGYGWNQVALAQLEVAIDHPSLHVLFSHSHNLFLDLVLWCGVPVGILVSIFLIGWFIRRILAITRPEDAVLLLFVVVVMNHAMLELPLHYAYFLLPTGLVMGALESRLSIQALVKTGRWAMLGIWLISAALLLLIVRDYARVEPNYQALRFEWAHIKTKPAETPDVLLLTQWREFFRMVRFEPAGGMRDADLAWMRDITGLYPSAGFVEKLATALALNQHPGEAALWLRRLCKVAAESQCAAAKTAWAVQSRQEPRIAAVAWPN